MVLESCLCSLPRSSMSNVRLLLFNGCIVWSAVLSGHCLKISIQFFFFHNWSNPRYIVIDQTMCVHKIGAGNSVISTSTNTTFNIIQHRIMMIHWFQQVSNFNLKADSILHRAQCPKHPAHDDASSDKSCINRKNRTRPRSSKTCLPRREFEGTWHIGIWRLLVWKLFCGAAERLCRVKPGAWATGWLQTLFVTVPCTKYDPFVFCRPSVV